MANVSLVGVDSAGGGIILGPGTSKLTVKGVKVSLLGDTIAPHGVSPHNASVVVQASTKLKVNGVGVVYAGCATSCGHTTTGSAKLTVSS